MSGSIAFPGFDPTIPLRAGQGVQQPNPLAMVGQYAQTANALNALKLFPGQQQLQQQQIQSNATSLVQQRRQAAYGSMVPLLGQQGQITDGDVVRALGGYEAAGGVSQPVLAELQQGAPGDPAAYDAWIRAKIAANSQTDSANAVRMVTPTTVPTAVGNRIVPLNYGAPGAPVPGAMTQPPGSQGLTLSPGEAAQRVPAGVDPVTGATLSAPLATVTPSSISGLPMGPGRNPYNVPPALLNPNRPTPPGAADANGVVPTGLGPAQSAALQTTGTQAAQGFQAISDEGVKARGQNALLANMQNDLANFTSGTGADKTLAWARFGESYNVPIMRVFGITPSKIAAQESFDKMANQLADAQGAGSDARLQVNQGANPSSGLSPEGADFIIRQLRGNADYLQARQQLAAQYPDKTDLQGFNAKTTAGLDPRVFQFNRLTPQQKTNYFYGITDTRERQQFMQHYYTAQKAGLLALPDAGQ